MVHWCLFITVLFCIFVICVSKNLKSEHTQGLKEKLQFIAEIDELANRLKRMSEFEEWIYGGLVDDDDYDPELQFPACIRCKLFTPMSNATILGLVPKFSGHADNSE